MSSITPNDLVGKQRQTYAGRGGYPNAGKQQSFKSSAKGLGPADHMTRAQRMKGFRDEKGGFEE